jgi:hypothetical protein
VEIFGVEGVRDYLHLIGSGHMLFFLQQLGSLELYSQQGREALMGKMQSFLHLNTHSAGKGSGASKIFILSCYLFDVTYRGILVV